MVILDQESPDLQERVTVEASTGPSSIFSVSETYARGLRREGLLLRRYWRG